MPGLKKYLKHIELNIMNNISLKIEKLNQAGNGMDLPGMDCGFYFN